MLKTVKIHQLDTKTIIFMIKLIMQVFYDPMKAYMIVAIFAAIEGESMLVAICMSSSMSQSKINVFFVFFIAFLVTFLVDEILFFIGRWGKNFINSTADRFGLKDYVAYLQKYVKERENLYIKIFRFVLGIRLLIPVIFGMDPTIKHQRFAFFNLISSLFWSFLCVTTGIFFGKIAIQFMSEAKITQILDIVFKFLLFFSAYRIVRLFFTMRSSIKNEKKQNNI